MPDEPSIESVIASKLADNAARKVTDVAVGSFFNLILGGDSGVESQLAAISAKLDTLQQAVDYLQPTLETYFHALIDIQVKAATISVNGYMATSGEQNLAQGVAGDLLATMPQQCAIFFAAAESLAAHYHNDDTLLDMLMGPDTNDPIRRAAAFVDHLLGTTAPARAWLWSGGGSSVYIGGNDVSLPSSTTPIGPVEVLVA